ncbi:MAG: RNA polymerase sigma factor region1.1 domain-containing protein, partial [Pseudomonadota bacterium]
MAKAQVEEREGDTDAPVLDMNASGVKKFVKEAKSKGYVTHDELNKVLPQDQLSSDQIEDVMATLSDMGINVVENEEEAESENRALTAKTDDPKAVVKKG